MITLFSFSLELSFKIENLFDSQFNELESANIKSYEKYQHKPPSYDRIRQILDLFSIYIRSLIIERKNKDSDFKKTTIT